ncbi:hypothetical protein BT96DRAFT_1017146 [Gymnopus androsaceus JB14]|uniref:Uncharacterized protein n=1 Tax=Gymnopus androsaceus JB14 TaxID=1447944 RepID=A0A6A4I1G1_9AGAR|nr:hypothetical protein BT96DRAFT_1017146 [Gymnopus androsaceus JB14]
MASYDYDYDQILVERQSKPRSPPSHLRTKGENSEGRMERKRLTALGNFSALFRPIRDDAGSRKPNDEDLDSTIELLKRQAEADDLYLHAKLAQQHEVLHAETLYRLLFGLNAAHGPFSGKKMSTSRGFSARIR